MRIRFIEPPEDQKGHLAVALPSMRMRKESEADAHSRSRLPPGTCVGQRELAAGVERAAEVFAINRLAGGLVDAAVAQYREVLIRHKIDPSSLIVEHIE